jgi:hypothetical protein
MHAALLSRPQEVTMLTRRIAASACALALVVPAAAAARPADNGPAVNQSGVAYGDTKYDLQNQQDLKAATPSYADQIGKMTDQQLSAAFGARNPSPSTANVYVPPADPSKVYASTKAAAPTQNPAVSADDTSDGWQIAAIAEAGVLAALAFGSVALVRARRRTPLGA